MRTELARTQFVGLARPASLGALLRIGPEPLSVFWSNPSRALHVTGLGVTGEGGGDVTWLTPRETTHQLTPSPRGGEGRGEGLPTAPPGPWFGGWAFDAARPWGGFDHERWILPEVLAWWDGGRAWLAAFAEAGTTATELERRLDRVEEVEPVTEQANARVSTADRNGWDGRVGRALAAIHEGTFDKLVLARVLEVESDRPFSERAVLKALEARHRQCWSFLVRGRDGRAFVGASPETLCESSGDAFSTDALAGTAALGEGASLLNSDKELREHRAVVEGIRDSLRTHCLELYAPAAPSVKSLSNVDHLHTPIAARLKPGVRALEVARSLHPTPAVAGRPRTSAIEWLRENEGFSRGWYAGAVGATGSAGTTLAVALRSALISGSRAQVFVGAGIVRGSTAEAEWLETERKSKAMLPALGVHHG